MQHQGPSEGAATNAACVKAAGDFCIPPYAEMAARVRSNRAGLSIIRPIIRERNPVFVASGLVELVADRPWVTLVSKFFLIQLLFSADRRCVRVAVGSPERDCKDGRGLES
jgi:hypothetical protein